MRPMRKWRGLSGEESWGSKLTHLIGREFNNRTVQLMAVSSISIAKDGLNCFLRALDHALKYISKVGSTRRIEVPIDAVVSCAIRSRSRAPNNSRNVRPAPTKWDPLSEIS